MEESESKEDPVVMETRSRYADWAIAIETGHRHPETRLESLSIPA